MKTFILGGDNCKYPFFPYQCRKAFHQLGHQVDNFSYRFCQLHRTQITNKLLHKFLFKKIISYDPDILLVTKGESILSGFINKIKKKGIKIVNWVLDDPTGKYYPENKVENIREYDAFFVFDPAYVPILKKQNPNTYYLPCAADPDIHREVIPIKDRKFNYDISFVGSHEPQREEFFKRLVKYDLHIWGFRWNKVNDSALKNRIHRGIPKGEDMCKIFNQSKIIINTHAKHSIKGLNLRTFEVPATKSFILTDYYSEINNLFGKNEIAYYRDNPVEKIDFYLTNPTQREKITLAGYKRVTKDHTMIERIKTLLKLLG